MFKTRVKATFKTTSKNIVAYIAEQIGKLLAVTSIKLIGYSVNHFNKDKEVECIEINLKDQIVAVSCCPFQEDWRIYYAKKFKNKIVRTLVS